MNALASDLASFAIWSSTVRICALSTPWNKSMKSSMVIPSARFAKREVIGSRVPLNTHAPLTFLGSRSTASHVSQIDMCSRHSLLRFWLIVDSTDGGYATASITSTDSEADGRSNL